MASNNVSISEVTNRDCSPVAGCTNEKESLDKNCYSNIACTKSRRKRCLTILYVVIAVIWSLLALPTVIYHLPKDSNSEMSKSVCIPQNYSGSVCREVLQSRQNCLPDRTATYDIIIAADPTSHQLVRDEQVCRLLGLFRSSSECLKTAITFLCLYIFPICDGNDLPYQLSRAEYRMITEGVCAEEIETAASVLRENQLSNYQMLSEVPLECNITTVRDEIVMNLSEVSLHSILKYCSTTKNCSEGFRIDNSTGLCLPECGAWEEFPHSFVVGTDAVVITAAIVYFFSSSVMLVISCINYKKMLTFPSIFIVYSVIALGALEVFVLTGLSNRTSLLCNSRELLKTIENSTLFCSIQGLVFCYALLMMELFWLFHIGTIFWRMKFPFHAKRMEMRGYFRHIHIIMLLTAIILPWASLGTMLGTEGFAMLRFPPRTCLIRNIDVVFYSFLLPISIINAIGISLITIILWILITTMGKFQRQSNDNEQSSMNAAKLKLLIVFIYFFIGSIFSLTAYTVVIKESTEFKTKLAKYFSCESQGMQPDRVCEKEFGRLNGDILVTMIYIFLGFYPMTNLVYVINVREMKRLFSRCLAHS